MTCFALLGAAASFATETVVFAQDAARPELSPMSRVPQQRAAQEKGEDDRVFGGREAAKGAWPFQVALLTSSMLDENANSQLNAQFCGGSLIAPQWVLTAAHCLVDYGAAIAPETVTVLTGATALGEGTRHAVAEVIVHEGYIPSRLDNDIGLLRLADTASEAAIKITDIDVETGDAMVTGWGRMENGAFPIALMEADLELKPSSACNSGIKEIYAHDLGRILRNFAPRMHYSDAAIKEATQEIAATMEDPLTDNMICAGVETGARDACNGDSGGPLFTTSGETPVQVGIVSWGEGPMDSEIACGHANAYGIYTRLSNYTDWVKQHAGM